MPYLPARISALNLLSHRIVEWMLWLPIRGTVNQWRRGAGLPVRGHPSPPGARRPFLAAFSPSIIPRPPDWTAGIHIAGYWFLDGRRDWQPPDGLVAFLAARPRPIYIGFGSNVERRPEKLTGLVLDALERTGSRAVLTTGWGALSERASEAAQISKRVYVAEDIPHDWLLPQVRAAIHHGGAGTTAACFRAGIPQVIVPFFTPDQWYWSYRVRSTGVGFGPVRRQGLSSQRLAKALDRVLASQRIQETAAKVGAKIRAEDGLGWTTNFLASYVDSS
jgi:UDP:flavonoid glycosyltransferase YjiC (YdhE family)